ncbi:DEAD/DEAH box helicase [Aerococcaceae bacterium DSM 111176]|nr:DEAD/DEAH box helicase [Aerococcaceae bacterium DSM 111176]
MKFKDIQLKPFLLEALEELHFNELTAVQEEVLPKAKEGKNLIVQSQTGSGKTHSFMIPIVNGVNPDLNQVQAVITAPSRELAGQLYEVAGQLVSKSETPISVVNYVGGTDKQRQIEKLNPKNQPQIVIGTPGRIFDLMSENALLIQTAKTLVVDEADMTMDLGFLSLVDEIASRLTSDVQIMVFSATIPQTLEVFLNKYLVSPVMIEISPKQVLADQIDNYLISTKGQSRKELIHELLTMGYTYLGIVFANTKKYADEISDYLKEQGLKVATIHGDIEPRERKRIMRQIRQLDYQYVVATDLAARGIDIPGVSLVINAELPKDLEFFIHRVGRTGRNQVAGTAITLVTPGDDHSIIELEKKGIEFKEVELRRGEFVEVDARKRRQQRKKTAANQDDTVVRGMIEKNKRRKVKPGYKQKLNRDIKEHQRKQTNEKKRQAGRQQRRSNKRG